MTGTNGRGRMSHFLVVEVATLQHCSGVAEDEVDGALSNNLAE